MLRIPEAVDFTTSPVLFKRKAMCGSRARLPVRSCRRGAAAGSDHICATTSSGTGGFSVIRSGGSSMCPATRHRAPHVFWWGLPTKVSQASTARTSPVLWRHSRAKPAMLHPQHDRRSAEAGDPSAAIQRVRALQVPAYSVRERDPASRARAGSARSIAAKNRDDDHRRPSTARDAVPTAKRAKSHKS